MTPIATPIRKVEIGMPHSRRSRGIPVYETLPSGKVRKRWLVREHRCTKKCLRTRWMFGLPFSWCARYSYAG